MKKQKDSRFNQNRHHNKARSNGGDNTRKNVIWLDVDFHNWMHKRFGNKTLDEIIEILQRLSKAKKNQIDGNLPMETYKERFG